MPSLENLADYTLFLDRDGTINVHRKNDYVKKISEFEFIPGVLERLAEITNLFKYVFIITNQQGIGKKIMSHDDLSEIHDHMLDQMSEHEVFINGIAYCAHLASEKCPCRKPETGMIDHVRERYPDIDQEKMIVVGDQETDMLLAKRVGAIPIMISQPPELRKQDNKRVYIPSLVDMSPSDILAWVTQWNQNF